MPIRSIHVALAASSAFVFAAGCASNQTASTSCCAATTADESDQTLVQVVNTFCPVAGDDFDSHERPKALARTRDGKNIGFCCKGCVVKFDAMTDAEKNKVLQTAVANKPGEAGCQD